MIRRAFKLVCYAGALGAGALVALAVSRTAVDGSGVPATEERPVGDVTEVVLTGVGDLTVVPGAVPSLRVTADDNVLPALESETRGGKLTLRTKSQTSIRPKTKIAYTLTAPRLSAVTISGVGNVTSSRIDADNLAVKLSGAGKAHLTNLTCKSLTLTLSGAGTAHLAGATDTLTVKLSGAGGIDAVGLKANAADVQISGAGNATVWADAELKARVSGAGGVKYKGRPAILEQKVSGAGRIRPLD